MAGSTSRTSTGSAGATGHGAPTDSRSSPTCCSPLSSSGGWMPSAPTSSQPPPTPATPPPTPAHPGYPAPNLQSHSEHRAERLVMAIGNRLLAQDEHGGALPTLYAAVADVPGNSFAGPGGSWSRGAPRSPSGAPPPPRTRPSPAASGTSPSS